MKTMKIDIIHYLMANSSWSNICKPLNFSHRSSSKMVNKQLIERIKQNKIVQLIPCIMQLVTIRPVYIILTLNKCIDFCLNFTLNICCKIKFSKLFYFCIYIAFFVSEIYTNLDKQRAISRPISSLLIQIRLQ